MIGGYLGQTYACLDDGMQEVLLMFSFFSFYFPLITLQETLPPTESARSCVIATKAFLAISIYMVIVIICSVLIAKRYRDRVMQLWLEEQGTALEMIAGDL